MITFHHFNHLKTHDVDFVDDKLVLFKKSMGMTFSWPSGSKRNVFSPEQLIDKPQQTAKMDNYKGKDEVEQLEKELARSKTTTRSLGRPA